MGDNATEIDLDSVIDRLLEGEFLFLAVANIICECSVNAGTVDWAYTLYSCGNLPLRSRADVAPLAAAFSMSLKASNGAHATSLVVFYPCSYALGWRCLEFYFHFIFHPRNYAVFVSGTRR